MGQKLKEGADNSAAGNLHALEHDIELTRHDLDVTLEALQAKLSPRRRLKAAVSSVRESGSLGAQRMIDLARRYPRPLAVLGGCLLLLMVTRQPRRSR
jgi:hypothetical protein